MAPAPAHQLEAQCHAGQPVFEEIRELGKRDIFGFDPLPYLRSKYLKMHAFFRFNGLVGSHHLIGLVRHCGLLPVAGVPDKHGYVFP